jgi:gluconolactonase
MKRTPLVLLASFLALTACQTTMKTTPPADSTSAAPRDPDFEALVPRDARLEKLAEGFDWTEGPIWRASGGYLLFSDIPRNTVYRWKEGEGLSVFLRPAGYTRPDPPGDELGTNALVFDAQDRLVMADHGNRQIARLDEVKFTRTTLADRFEGKRLNSPNDLIFHSNGDLYFTDPPYGLRGLNQNPTKELEVNGVYRLTPAGELTLLIRDLTFPNGVALSPDEKTLYVSNSDPRRPVWMAYELREDGSLGAGRVLFDASALVRERKRGSPDGMTVDRNGNLFAAGPGGVLVITPDGRHLGTIETEQVAANCTFGDDGSTLYITADAELLRIRLNTKGARF